MNVAGLQMDIVWESPEENIEHADELAAHAAGAGAGLVVLPEMFNTGFTMNAGEAGRHAEETLQAMGNIARDHGVWVIGGFVEPGRRGEKPRNACGVLDPRGRERLRYHKIHPFTHAGEQEHYEPGRAVATVDIEGLRVTPLICYDLRFPEPFRIAATDTDLFVVIANWPRERREAWRTLLRARAIENQTFVLGVNRVGKGDDLEYAGDSALIDPMGAAVAENGDGVAIVLGEVTASEVRDARERFSFLADRRPEVYDGVVAARAEGSQID